MSPIRPSYQAAPSWGRVDLSAKPPSGCNPGTAAASCLRTTNRSKVSRPETTFDLFFLEVLQMSARRHTHFRDYGHEAYLLKNWRLILKGLCNVRSQIVENKRKMRAVSRSFNWGLGFFRENLILFTREPKPNCFLAPSRRGDHGPEDSPVPRPRPLGHPLMQDASRSSCTPTQGANVFGMILETGQ